ncbi:MAG TPA: ubiquitin-like small modifier protein 1 [Anaerolineales bacterium]|nr:ubiquitin-like small modifier protein 1 [Anaerolineales bacterium]HLB50163.1 ubiquitin-like small modifier protein 1 [Anaerolineales bacterium]
MPTIRIPTPLRPYAAGKTEVAVAGDTVGAALSDLTVRHPDLRKHLYADTGELRAFVNVFLGQEDVRHLQGVKTALKDNDQLRIVPSVAGGLMDCHSERRSREESQAKPRDASTLRASA